MKEKTILILCICFLLLCGSACGATEEEKAVDTAVKETAAYLYQTVDAPQLGSVGGEWTVLGLARSGYSVPQEYFDQYYGRIVAFMENSGGILGERKHTEYSRVILALTAIGKDPSNVGGYDLLKPLGDFENTVLQGINGPIWALIALDAGKYEIPANESTSIQAGRDMYLKEIISQQLTDGGFSLGSQAGYDSADPDITAMVLQALSKYTDREDVAGIVDQALSCLSQIQNEDGGYISWGSTNSESCAQVIVALTELGIPLDDERFVKNGHTLIDNLLSFRMEDGGFAHTLEMGESNLMATEQAFYALVAAQRAQKGESSLYRMK